MNPSSEASGVRSSWLALAMKSTRMPLDPADLGQVAQRQQRRLDPAVRPRQRGDADVEKPLDRNALDPLHGLGFPAGDHAAIGVDTSGALSARTSGSPSLRTDRRFSAG